jgi:hypothetical protein
MTRQTSLHGWTVPTEGDADYENTFDDFFVDLDTNGEIRDVESNLSNYSPKSGAKFVATDTENEYIGDGNNWNQLQTSGKNPNFNSLNTSNETTIAKIERDSRETQFDDTSFNAVLDVVGSSSGEIMITRHSGGSNSPQLAAVIFAYWSADNGTNATAVSEQVNGTDRGLDVQWSGFTLEVAQRGVSSPGTVTVEPRAAGADYTWQI